MSDRLSRDGVTFLVRAMINFEEAHMGSSGDPYGVRAVRAGALRAVLDAYEAQRPRPASEAPEARGLVLVRHDSAPGRYQPAWYEPRASPPKRWLWESRNWIDPSAILAWLPLPPAPERDDG